MMNHSPTIYYMAIYCLGDEKLLGDKYRRIAIVGSRRMTDYGKRVIGKIVPSLVEAGLVIVSGFMYGVDQEVHKACLECGGKTVAVLGWGIDWKVPEEDLALYNSIKENGLLISEYPGKALPARWMFPQRNKVVVKISEAVLIVEAAEKSGSLITARLAMKQNKKLFAVPGPVTSSVSTGTNNLIKTGEAAMVTRAEDVLEELGMRFHLGGDPLGHHPRRNLDNAGTNLERSILTALENEGLLVEELAYKIREPIEKLVPVLSMMELSGTIVCRNGRYYLA